MFSKIVGLIGIVTLVGALVACGSAEPKTRMQPQQPAPAAQAAPVAQQVVSAPAQPAPAAPAAPAAMSEAPAAERIERSESVASDEAEAPAAGPAYQPVSISAGEIDDNQRWVEYIKYREGYEGPQVNDFDVSERYIITVVDAVGYPVPNATVRIATEEAVDLFEGRTYANGQTIFFPRVLPESDDFQSFTVHVEVDGVTGSDRFARIEGSDWTVILDATVEPSARVPLDLLFLLDATGSMSDEIDQIKSTLLSISSRISDLPSDTDLRFGMVAYRDRGDDFVTRTYHFEPDVQKFLNSIREVRADAPPHLDYAQDYDYAVEMVEANRQGIKIFPIASSGLDAQGEYIFRQIAVHTMGRFLFILYGGSTPHSVGQYSVENLDDLVVKLVEAELAHLSR